MAVENTLTKCLSKIRRNSNVLRSGKSGHQLHLTDYDESSYTNNEMRLLRLELKNLRSENAKLRKMLEIGLQK